MSSAADAHARLTAALGRLAADPGRPAPVVLIDGPSGAGKSSLADRIVAEWPGDVAPVLVRMDDLYPGWGGLAAAAGALGAELLGPLRRTGRGRWRRWDWAADRPAEWHEVDGVRPLIVEGCGTLTAGNAADADLCIWLDADDTLRKERALARDGLAFETHWDEWQHDFEAYLEREQPRHNADLILDVTEWPLPVQAVPRPED
ncbi:ATP-binding protein [Leifsonia poae]|uniref:Uncharacterized protein n=1 Tax=Leifsonia poae TaxID=110933 RepID=A0A9W6HCY9_9MICO|nr:ATP-binding protein [Leifsonia poae]GLJ77838.1 hypothetical protein GCM10017584_34120 [Leifsonia poae]